MSPEIRFDNHGNKFFELKQDDIKKVIRYVREHGEEPINIKKILDIALQYKKAGLTPLFLTNEDETFIKITTEELWGKKLH